MGSGAEDRCFRFHRLRRGFRGAAVAARLSEDGRHAVLLLEAGSPDRSSWFHIPFGPGCGFFHHAIGEKAAAMILEDARA